MKNFFLLIFIVLQITGFSQEICNKKETLNIISWNVYMLPALANLSNEIDKSYKTKRAKEISKIMNNSDYDIIIFQEAFYIPARKILQKELKKKYPFQYGPINKSFIKTNSGIFIVSKIELTELANTKYKDCDGSDCLAKKGAAIFEGKFHGNSFQIIGTHLDSRSQEVRGKQYFQMYEELIKPFFKENVPLFICGDMNTKIKNSKNYNYMLETLKCEDIETVSEQKNTTVNNNVVIDYIFIKRNNSKLQIVDKSITTFKAEFKYINVLKGTLSDHLAVEIRVKF